MGLRRELARMEATLSQVHSEYARKDKRREEEMSEQALQAQECEMKTSQAANGMLRDFMKTESAQIAELSKSEKSFAARSHLETAALTECRAESEHLAASLKNCEGTLEYVAKSQHERNRNRQARLARPLDVVQLESMLQHNIAREMRTVREGLVLSKVDQKHKGQSERMTMVDDEKFELLWGHHSEGLSLGVLNPLNVRHNMKVARGAMQSLDLKEVIRIEYGGKSRASVLQPDISPWLCFSLYTTDRSFDFICPDEWAVQCFVLVTSRLCLMSGDGVNGAIGNRRQFQSRKGWCKVEDTCIKSKKTLPRLLLETLRRVRPRFRTSVGIMTGRTKSTKNVTAGDEDNPFSGTNSDGSRKNPFTFFQPSSGHDEDDDDDDDDDEK